MTLKLIYPAHQTLKNFQADGIQLMARHMLANKVGCYNADEQGLGKTIQSAVLSESIGAETNLVVAPAVAVLTWEQELKQWVKTSKIKAITTTAQLKKTDLSQFNWVIVSYNLLRVNIEYFQRAWLLLFLDESHNLKNRRSQRSKAVLEKLWPYCGFRIALSGTPYKKHLVDGYSLFSKFAPAEFGTFSEFAARYTYPSMTPWGFKYKGVRNEKELLDICRSKFLIRRLKKDVMKELPPKVFTPIYLEDKYRVKIPKDESERAAQEFAAIKEKLDYGIDVTVFPESIAGLRRLQAEQKVPAVLEFAENLLEQEIPIVIFAHHKSVVSMLNEGLKNYTPLVTTGATPPKQRLRNMNDFQAGKSKVFIGNMEAAGVNITLTASSNVLLAEPDWSPAIVSQACDRCHRIGQKDTVNVYYFVVPESIDADIIKTLVDKAQSFSKALGDSA